MFIVELSVLYLVESNELNMSIIEEIDTMDVLRNDEDRELRDRKKLAQKQEDYAGDIVAAVDHFNYYFIGIHGNGTNSTYDSSSSMILM
ncbi:hypothetical protein J6590_094342 [Homalodisca vitripennis]|nr:hypothetical protein J6590_094342 [Homalodisca vitripennis]